MKVRWCVIGFVLTVYFRALWSHKNLQNTTNTYYENRDQKWLTVWK